MPSEKLIQAVTHAYPDASEILVSFPDAWELVDTLKLVRGDRTSPFYIAAMPPEPERPARDHFAGLPAEVNLTLDSYRLYRFFEPWQMPTLLIDWNPQVGSGRVVGQTGSKVQLHDLGDAQTWTGKNI